MLNRGLNFSLFKFFWMKIHSKVTFFHQCSKMQIIPIKKLNIHTCFFQFLWFFRLKCWFQGQIIPRIHLILINAYTQMCFERNINGNRDVNFLECDCLLVQRCVKLTLARDAEACYWVGFLILVRATCTSWAFPTLTKCYDRPVLSCQKTREVAIWTLVRR